MALRTDYANTTDATDTHPAAHNDANAAINALETRLAALEKLRRGPSGWWIYPWDPNMVATTATHAGRHWRGARGAMVQAFDALAFEVTTAAAAGTTAKVAIYNTDANGLPTSLAFGSAAIDVTTTGIKTVTFTALPAGVYWLGVIVSADTVLRYINTAGASWVSPSSAAATTLASANFGWQLFVSAFATNGILPDPFPAPSANTVTSTSPVMHLRIA